LIRADDKKEARRKPGFFTLRLRTNYSGQKKRISGVATAGDN